MSGVFIDYFYHFYESERRKIERNETVNFALNGNYKLFPSGNGNRDNNSPLVSDWVRRRTCGIRTIFAHEFVDRIANIGYEARLIKISKLSYLRREDRINLLQCEAKFN